MKGASLVESRLVAEFDLQSVVIGVDVALCDGMSRHDESPQEFWTIAGAFWILACKVLIGKMILVAKRT